MEGGELGMFCRRESRSLGPRFGGVSRIFFFLPCECIHCLWALRADFKVQLGVFCPVLTPAEHPNTEIKFQGNKTPSFPYPVSIQKMDQHQLMLQNRIVKTTFAIKSKEAAIQSIDDIQEDEKVYREVSRMFILNTKSSLKLQLQQELDDLKALLNKMKPNESNPTPANSSATSCLISPTSVHSHSISSGSRPPRHFIGKLPCFFSWSTLPLGAKFCTPAHLPEKASGKEPDAS
ncbi:Prefoldin subunit [Cryptosporidium felis]|nr:Prefoldin subunit [Cryptosporidium felis]